MELSPAFRVFHFPTSSSTGNSARQRRGVHQRNMTPNQITWSTSRVLSLCTITYFKHKNLKKTCVLIRIKTNQCTYSSLNEGML